MVAEMDQAGVAMGILQCDHVYGDLAEYFGAAMRDQVGAAKLLWGSDCPLGMSAWCTYRQAIDFIRRHCDFLSGEEKALILGGNAARLFGIEAP